jgi:DNA-binding LacI/PurR family transcriptional regulator
MGIISFNETTLKEVLDITVITTDFEAMGRRAAEVVLQKIFVSEKNPFYIINRGSA